ncbi:MAG: aminomethyl-transferring glycine dehydrogenase subunit GcvPA [Clostridiales bacterium]|nr:aminomethyl-transferring glycine dehydrogenase subunit GcvPA [Clostridiales bacterium]
MGSYIPSTESQRAQMLAEIGLPSCDGLFRDVPDDVKLQGSLDLPEGLSELEAQMRMRELADRNRVFPHIFRGAGAYRHYIPSIVRHVSAKEEFVTAYTPYQPEISQGLLQSIFEFQTMICELTGMDVSNASLYDGASAAAEAAAMCIERRRSRVLVSAAAHPQVIETIRTYCYAKGTPFVLIPEKDGVTDAEALRQALDDLSACVYIQQPNYYGNLENAAAIGETVRQAGAKYIMGCNPIALAVLEPPGACGADIAVGEGQPLGLPLAFGGPYLGFLAAKSALARRLPGRIAGETTDGQGRRAFVLTLQAREQHIRREKALSNVCSNQALCALTASAYMASMGKSGMQTAARHCMRNARLLRQGLADCGLKPKYDRAFFHEFVTVSDTSSQAILEALEEKEILGGLALSGTEILWCATECNTQAEMKTLCDTVKEVCGR